MALQSKTFRSSHWVDHELAFARAHHIGVYSLRTPDGQMLAQVQESKRLRLARSMLAKPSRPLRPKALQQVCDWIISEYETAELHRSRLFRSSLSLAFANEGCNVQSWSPSGGLDIQTPSHRRVFVGSTCRPPRTSDYQATHQEGAGAHASLLVAPTTYASPATIETARWLTNVTAVSLEDAADVDGIARRYST